MSLQQLGANFAKDMRATDSLDATYHPHGLDYSNAKFSIKVQLGESITVSEGDTVNVETKTFDFIINVDQLTTLTTNYTRHRPDSERGLPIPGEKIEFDSKLYEIVNPQGQKCWEYHDRFKTSIRVHTTQVWKQGDY